MIIEYELKWERYEILTFSRIFHEYHCNNTSEEILFRTKYT